MLFIERPLLFIERLLLFDEIIHPLVGGPLLLDEAIHPVVEGGESLWQRQKFVAENEPASLRIECGVFPEQPKQVI